MLMPNLDLVEKKAITLYLPRKEKKDFHRSKEFSIPFPFDGELRFFSLPATST